MATKPDDTGDDAFADAFAQFTTRDEDKGPADDAAADGAEGGAAADAAAGDGGDKPAGDSDGGADTAGGAGDGDGSGDSAGSDGAATGGEGEGGGDAKPAVSNPNTADTAAADDVLARLSSLLKEAPAKEEPAPQQQTEQLPEIYSKEEQDFLKEYDEEWGDVAKGEALKRRAEYRELMQYMFSEVTKHVGPLAEMVTELATRTHLGDLQERVPDYNDLRDNVVTWVETQPAYLQAGMKQVMQQGTADEVADLIGRYRKDTGAAAPAAETGPEQKAELSDDAKKAAQALAPVSTKRSVIPQDDSLDDFDAAFAKFAGKPK